LEVEDVVKQLERIFEAITRYQESSRYFDFVMEYIIYVSEEEQYIPNAIKHLYKKGELEFNDIYYLCFEYDLYKEYKNGKNGKKGNHQFFKPFFLNKRFAKEINYLQRSYKYTKEEYERCKDEKHLESIALTRSPQKEEFVFDIEKLHIKLIRELQEKTEQSVCIKNGNVLFNDGKVVIKFRDTLMSSIIEQLSNIKMGSYISYDEIAENIGVEYNKSFRDKMYQASRRINSKILKEVKVDNFLEYDTKQVRVNPRT